MHTAALDAQHHAEVERRPVRVHHAAIRARVVSGRRAKFGERRATVRVDEVARASDARRGEMPRVPADDADGVARGFAVDVARRVIAAERRPETHRSRVRPPRGGLEIADTDA